MQRRIDEKGGVIMDHNELNDIAFCIGAVVAFVLGFGFWYVFLQPTAEDELENACRELRIKKLMNQKRK